MGKNSDLRNEFPTIHATTTAEIGKDSNWRDCGGPVNTIRWMAAVNLVSGVVYIGMGVAHACISKLSPVFGAAGGVEIACGLLLITAGIVLLVGLKQKSPTHFTVWLALICVYFVFNLAAVVCVGIAMSAASYAAGTLAALILFTFSQSCGIAAVQKSRRQLNL